MKILELRFKNLNSLYGEWMIDFTDPEYASNGIFALTGPTGAGKSTILDAICLALYGATPRLGKITQSGNEILSRQTGECYAEVVFESQAGRFRCNWRQRRAHKKAEGKLQDQEHQIADAITGKLIETKKSLVGGAIEERTGMDFDRFTRSILLAQGGFDTFLKANVEEKSKILEQITGTKIYSDISRRVHERQREEEQKLKILTAETSGITVLTPEEEQDIQAALVSHQKQESELSKKTEKIGQAITWLQTIEALKTEISSLNDEAKQLTSEFEAFKPKRTQLERATSAASLEGQYATLSALRKQQADDQHALKTEEALLPELDASATQQAEALKAAEQATQNAKTALKTATPLIHKIRSLDQTIVTQEKAVAEATAACTKKSADIETEQQKLAQAQSKQKDATQALAATTTYLTNHAADEWLISELAGLEEQVNSLIAKKREISDNEKAAAQAKSALTTATKKLTQASEHCAQKKQTLTEASQKLEETTKALSEHLGEKLLREYRTEKETLLREMAFRKRIEALEAHRAKLADGEPCPLCGATEHPFAEGNVPIPDEIEQQISALAQHIEKAEALESTRNTLTQTEISARNALNDSEKLETDARNQKIASEKSLADINTQAEKLHAGFNTLKQALFEKLHPLGITELPDRDIEELLGTLKKRRAAWTQKTSEKHTLEKQLAKHESDINRLSAIITMHTNALTEQKKTLIAQQKKLAEYKTERQNTYGTKCPDKEEAQLNQAITQAEANEHNARSQHNAVQQKLTRAKTQIDGLKQRISRRTPELTQSETAFSAALAAVHFADEKAFLEARLSPEERAALSAEADTLEKRQTTLDTKQKDRAARLADESAKNLTDKTLEQLAPESKAMEASLAELRDALAGFKHKLKANTDAQAQIKEKRSAIEAQQRECEHWNKLHELIGSADGKKYRNFAQGLTFELMVSHANRQLNKMTDRYLLIRDEKEPLELSVVDGYQAGEIRSTKNLSGGESFIISLTLALGLSQMASRKVRVDSLFLDEGFGTLDEDALETALETLSGLQQDGKLIGIISHVSALKERISTQIKVTPTSGGRSVLSGPGCGKVGDGG